MNAQKSSSFNTNIENLENKADIYIINDDIITKKNFALYLLSYLQNKKYLLP